MRLLCLVFLLALPGDSTLSAPVPPLPKIRVAADSRTVADETGKPFVPFGVNYYRPGTGWAPQVWKTFDAEATRRTVHWLHLSRNK
jgi:hypothetical protein